MTRTLSIAIAALAGLAPPLSAWAQADGPGLTKGEQELAELLEGRAPGEPVNCLTRRGNTERMNVIDGTALVFGRGDTIYVNIPDHPRTLDDSDIVVTKSYSTRLCRTDIVNTIDRTVGFYTGNIMLNEFVPYTRVD